VFIYLITNSVNGLLYVGQTIKTPEWRWRGHVGTARRGKAGGLNGAIREFGAEAFKIDVLESDVSSKDVLDRLEIFWIEKLDCTNPDVGYNSHSGGNGGNSDETRAKISASRKGVAGPPEMYEANSINFTGEGNPFFGKHHTQESKDKVSRTKIENHWVPTEEWLAAQRARSGENNSMFGRKLSPASRAKMKARWAERRALGMKMNLTEEQRDLRRQQAATMRERKALARQPVTAV
jgi:group I intron endonuclease